MTPPRKTPPPDEDFPDGEDPIGPDDDPSFDVPEQEFRGMDEVVEAMFRNFQELDGFLRMVEGMGIHSPARVHRELLERIQRTFGKRPFSPAEANERLAADPRVLRHLAAFGLLRIVAYRAPDTASDGWPMAAWGMRQMARASWRRYRATLHRVRDSLMARGTL